MHCAPPFCWDFAQGWAAGLSCTATDIALGEYCSVHHPGCALSKDPVVGRAASVTAASPSRPYDVLAVHYWYQCIMLTSVYATMHAPLHN